MLDPGPTPRILITRLSAIGDCIHTLPLLSALRSQFPNAYIGWVMQSAPASLMKGHNALDALITVDRRWLNNLKSIRSTRGELSAHRFDIAIDPQSLTKSSLLGWLSGAQHRIGFASGQGRELCPFLSTTRVVPQQAHVVDRYMELLRPLGVQNQKVRFELPSRVHAHESVQRFVAQFGTTSFALLNPGAGWNSKCWPHERYAKVARHLSMKHGIRSVVVWSGKHERTWAEDIVAKSRNCTVLAPDTTLSELAEFCGAAVMFVGSDTGPMHLSAAKGTPCVAMFGPTLISECGPYGTGHEPLQAYYQDGSSRQRRGDDNSAMQAITVESVYAACDRIISAQSIKVA